MLIQVQNQREQEQDEKLTEIGCGEEKSSVREISSYVEVKTENDKEPDNELEEAKVQEGTSKSTQENEDVDMKDIDNEKDRKAIVRVDESNRLDDDETSQEINIDPRTYCKLGHFHLLLEDYAKGKYYFF